MNPNERMLLHLLGAAIHGADPNPAMAEGIEWEALFMLAQEHKIDAMLLDTVYRLPSAAQPPSAVLAAWQENAMLTMMGQALLVGQLHHLLAAFDATGLQAVVLKGVVLKPLYPQPDLRTMNDADLLVRADDIGAARRVMEESEYALIEQEPSVYVYGGPQGLRVELHERLFDRTAYGFLSRLDEEAMFPISLATREAVYGGEAWVLPPMQHALFMLCHMAKHMITTGFGLRQTTDFVLYAQAHDDDMDWDAFWAQARTLGLYPFASAIQQLGVQYLSMPRGKWSEGALEDPAAAEGLLLDLLDAGVFGHRTEERKRSAAVVYRSYDAKDGDAGRVRRALFPSASSLKAPYLYARDHPVLLPIAWVHRLINYGISLLTGKAKHADTAASLQVADDRMRLLSALGLRDEE